MERTQLRVLPAAATLIQSEREWDEPSFIAESSFVKAPLNSRIDTNNPTSKGKGKAKQENLDRVPIEIQEALILEDLLFVLMVRMLLPKILWR
jgi:hypothetical protein